MVQGQPSVWIHIAVSVSPAPPLSFLSVVVTVPEAFSGLRVLSLT